MVEQARAEMGNRRCATHCHAFVSFLFSMPVDYRSWGRKWSQMAGESTQRFSIAGNSSFSKSFCTLTDHPAHILWV